MRRAGIAASGCVALWVLAAGGAIPAAAPADESQTTAGSDFHETLFWVPSSGFIADRTFIAVSKGQGPSRIAQQLAEALTNAQRGKFQITVCGKAEAKTLQVVKDAFDILAGVDLHDLDFTFVGTPHASQRVAKWVAAVGGTFHTREELGYSIDTGR
jgi:hypothetical protein